MGESKQEQQKPLRVAVAMSGGVDSALSAILLKEAGYMVTGLHFLLPSSRKMKNSRLDQVRNLTAFMGIPLETLDLEVEFKHRIIDPFIASYLQGLTPNPCALCNGVIKLDQLIRYADDRGISYVATGHYAQVIGDPNKGKGLGRGVDRKKEQSYFLHRLQQMHLQRLILPLGEMTKDTVRRMAKEKGLPNYSQPESQEICFLPDNDYRSFLEAEMGTGKKTGGDIVDRSGRILGRHQGVYRYTIGQRHGLGIASERPYYVLRLSPSKNQVIVGRKEELYRDYVEACEFNWIRGIPPEVKMVKALAQIRYRHKAASGRLQILSKTSVRFHFDEPQPAVAPGQALVCYDGDIVLGGGWIKGTKEDPSR